MDLAGVGRGFTLWLTLRRPALFTWAIVLFRQRRTPVLGDRRSKGVQVLVGHVGFVQEGIRCIAQPRRIQRRHDSVPQWSPDEFAWETSGASDISAFSVAAAMEPRRVRLGDTDSDHPGRRIGGAGSVFSLAALGVSP